MAFPNDGRTGNYETVKIFTDSIWGLADTSESAGTATD